MEDWVQIPVWVPKERIPEFYEMHGRWLRRNDSVPLVTEKGLATNEESAGRPWTEDSEDAENVLRDAAAIYVRLTSNAQRILDYWMDNPGTRFSPDELAERLNFANPQVLAGTLASVGLRSRRVRREIPYRYEATESGGQYWIEPETAAIFLKMRDGLARAHPRITDAPRRVREIEQLESELALLKGQHAASVERQVSAERLSELQEKIEAIERRLRSIRSQLGLDLT